MKVKCLYNTGKSLMEYDVRSSGISEITEFGQLKIGEEYLVMGMILGSGQLTYLLDSGRIISDCPYQLFEVVDGKMPPNWFFRPFTKEDDIFPYKQAIWGYRELCFDDNHYEQLIEMNEQAHKLYFKRKVEFEKSLGEL